MLITNSCKVIRMESVLPIKSNARFPVFTLDFYVCVLDVTGDALLFAFLHPGRTVQGRGSRREVSSGQVGIGCHHSCFCYLPC